VPGVLRELMNAERRQVEQPVLWDKPPRARKTDPISSHLAADELERSGRLNVQQALALAAVRKCPGRSSRELGRLSPLDRYQLARRLPELETLGLVKRGMVRECGVSRRLALTWWPGPGRARRNDRS
jgi:hypothetical protein